MLTTPFPAPFDLAPPVAPPLSVPSITPGVKQQRIHWVDDNILPEQFFGPRTSVGAVRPEAALMRAVLEEALVCLQGHFGVMGQRGHRLAQEAEAWFLSEDTHWPFAFVSICEVLGLEPAAVREALLRWRHNPSLIRPKKIRRSVTVPRAMRLSA